jgi:site-specific recombinase XerD
MKKLADEQTLGAISPTDWKRGRIDQAVRLFLEQKSYLAPNTLANYRCVLDHFAASAGGDSQLNNLTVEWFDRYSVLRRLSPSSWMTELTILRCFFGFCLRRKWCSDNPAKLVDTPRGVNRSRQVDPYADDEMAAMLDVAANLPYAYDRWRSRAAILLMRYIGLRVCDVAALRRDAVSGGMITLRAKKNDMAVRLPVPEHLQSALSLVPRTSDKFFFWRGRSKRQLERLLDKVFKKAGVNGATPHRFRHTLATEMLSRGATMDDVADVLGDHPDTVRKHYAKWTPAREERLGRLLG